MKKLLIVLAVYLLVGALGFSLADPVDLVLNTTILGTSVLTVNGVSGPNSSSQLEINTLGAPVTVSYSYIGNQPVKLKVTSFNATTYSTGFRLIVSGTPSEFIPYSLAIDYDGLGTYSATASGTSVNLPTSTGIYNLNSTMQITLQDGVYGAGTYTDTLTFEIEAQ